MTTSQPQQLNPHIELSEANDYERAAVINLDALSANVRRIAAQVAPAQVMAVVKADAYGHGALACAQTALEAGAQWLGVAHVSEALSLRNAGIQAPILAWLHTYRTDFDAAVGHDIDLGVSGWELDRVAQAAKEQARPARVHLKIDTGLGRNGSTAEQWDSLVGSAIDYQDQGLLRVVGIFSHFAVADDVQRPETDDQLARFKEALAVAEDAGVDPEVRHIANTPAIFSRPDSHFDLVRAGVGCYGLSPFSNQRAEELGLRPVMTLQARVANCKRVPAGQGVSYGLNYRTSAATTLALIPLGYADGVPRVATGGPVRLNNEVYSEVGRIAMDQFVIDLGGEVDPAEILDEVAVLFGEAGHGGVPGNPSVDVWAAEAGTINYEVVTRISSRVPRVYVRDHGEDGRPEGKH